MHGMDAPLTGVELPVCSGCGLPIQNEPLTHHSILGEWFIGHTFECLLEAHAKKCKELAIKAPERVERWLDDTGYNTYPQHDDLMRGIK
jgi:hypothetical protein